MEAVLQPWPQTLIELTLCSVWLYATFNAALFFFWINLSPSLLTIQFSRLYQISSHHHILHFHLSEEFIIYCV
jgi:hypothetical protein